MDADRFLTYSLRDPRLTRILNAALEAVEPGRIVHRHLEKTVLPPHERLFLLGIGKAAEPMTIAAAGFLEDFEDALIITKHLSGTAQGTISSKIMERITAQEAGHPIPDERSLAAGQAVLDFVSRINENDLLICLISGGASSLVAAPRQGISLIDIQTLTASMLTLGATIEELNILRCQIDELKGGGLVRAAKGRIISLILSDVIGDHLAIIASGLTVPYHTNRDKLLTVLIKYEMKERASSNLLNLITTEIKSDDSLFAQVQNVIVANNKFAAQGSKEQAQTQGFFTEIIDMNLHGEAHRMGKQLAAALKIATRQKKPPFCLISGGETTVTIHGDGKGGRNQELALAAVDVLKDLQNVMLVSLATDGNDGPTDAAGAVVSGETYRRSIKLGMKPSEYLARNDAYSFFEALGDLLKPGYTGTNVNDLIFLFGL
jgi:glycerate 2-kinase